MGDKLKKYTDGNRVIYSTEKAFEILYKKQGFKLVGQLENKITKEEETKVDYSSLKYNDLRKLATEKGIENTIGIKKEELIKALEELEE